MMGKTFLELRCMRWERKSVKRATAQKTGLFGRPSQCRPCAVIWSVLTELSRGMEKIIHRNVWGALKRSGPFDWPMGVKPAERRANFFLMNSAACSTMQSDCQGWTHIWSVFRGSKWQDQFCLERKGGGGVGRIWLLLAPPLYFISLRCCWVAPQEIHPWHHSFPLHIQIAVWAVLLFFFINYSSSMVFCLNK